MVYYLNLKLKYVTGHMLLASMSTSYWNDVENIKDSRMSRAMFDISSYWYA